MLHSQRLQSHQRPGSVALDEQNLVINGNTTEYKWVKTDGTVLVDGSDYTLRMDSHDSRQSTVMPYIARLPLALSPPYRREYRAHY